jgi:hypothetical protein
MPPIIPVYFGRLCRGKAREIIMIAPDWTPAQPTPANALPIISARELGATAQMSDPSSKTASAVRNTPRTENSLYNLPKGSWKQHEDNK